ncbi:arabinose ABC transporter permease [Pontibacillus chungwhensis BH030062]|uniref:Arabinose ABC transporter permease n=1 Tax=Pontibacillus chungwhensis BH030062 TaxID=1385513 RepID=A0A0A2UV53_9BACI|nr:arabinose ABC transporter permease [Pontibacillus chungwhensis BH030062]
MWRNQNFVPYFLANALSNLGNWFDFVAVLILFRYTWQADPMLIALIPIMYAIPSILLGQFAGVFADRKDKRKVLIYSDWIRGGLTLLIVLTTSPWFALPVLFLRNAVGVVSFPAQQGLMRSIVLEEDIMKAVTINGSLYQLMKVVGPLIGGSVTGFFSPEVSIVVNAASFILSGLILLKVEVKHQDLGENEVDEGKEAVRFLTSWKEGWRIVLKSQVLFASMMFGIVSTLTIQMIDTQIVTLFSEVFPNKPEITGWAISGIGMGSLIVVLYLNRLDEILRYGWFFGMGSALIGVMVLGFGFLDHFNLVTVALGLSIIGGIGNGITFTAINYLIQKEPPQEAIGRVSGIVDSTLSVLFIAGPLLGGILISQFGVLLAFKGIGISLAMIGLLGIVLQNFIWGERPTFSKSQLEREAYPEIEKGGEQV